MTTMHSFYQQFSSPAPSNDYWSSLMALARSGLRYLRSVQPRLVWEVWN